MYSRVMEDQFRLLDMVSKGSGRAIHKAKMLLDERVKETLSRLAVGAAKNNNRV